MRLFKEIYINIFGNRLNKLERLHIISMQANGAMREDRVPILEDVTLELVTRHHKW